MTRLGIDLRIIHYAKTGFYRYAQGLIGSLERAATNDREVLLLRHPADCGHAPAGSRLREIAVKTPVFDAAEGPRLREELAPLHLDMIHFPFSLFPCRAARRVILTVHDLTCLQFPDFIEPRYLPFYRDSLLQAARADLVVAPSNGIATQLAAAGLPRESIRSCYPLTPFENGYAIRAADDAALVDRELQDRLRQHPFILCVGSLEPRKNHGAALAAFTHFRQSTRERLLLVFAGWHGWSMESFFEALRRSPLRDDVCLVRDANDATLRELFRRCQLFLNLSLYEGFGLPVLEALEQGACVLSTPTPSLVESGFPAEGLLDGSDTPAAAHRIAELMTDPGARRDLAARSRETVGAFYRSRDPDRLIDVYS
jgi:glycosyltransferase involved in cell wall biosynthesis